MRQWRRRCLNSICLTPLCSGWMCQLCAPDRAVEPHPPLHLWDGGVPANLHVYQPRLEGRGERTDVYVFPLEQDLLLKPLCSSRPGKLRPDKYFRTTNWDSDLFMIFPCSPVTSIFNASSCLMQDYLFRLVPGYMDSGKGKCSYDPKQESVAVLLSKIFFSFWVEKHKNWSKFLSLQSLAVSLSCFSPFCRW